MSLPGASGVSFNGTMLVVGGQGSNFIYQLDPVRMDWFRRKEELEMPRTSMVAFAAPKNLYQLRPKTRELFQPFI